MTRTGDSTRSRRTSTTLDARWRLVFICLAVVLSSGAALADESLLWELRPYRVDVRIVTDAAPAWTEYRLADVIADLQSRARSAYGASWALNVAIVGDAALRARARDVFAAADPGSGAELAQQLVANGCDKLIVVSLNRTSSAGYTTAAREWDNFARVWGPTIHRDFDQPSLANRAVFQSVAAAFSQLGLLVSVNDGECTFRVRAAQLNARSGNPFPVGSVARLALRRPDAAGTPIDELFLRVGGTDGGKVTARLVSRFRQPLEPGEYVVLGIATQPDTTDVQIIRAADGGAPVAGLNVLALDEDDQTPQYLGRTDENGWARVTAGRSPLRTVVVQSGGHTLAEVPVVPGWQEKLTLQIAIDDQSLPALGAMEAARAKLFDLIVRREVTLRRAKARSTAGQAAAAQQLLDEFRAELAPSQARLRKFIEDSKAESRIADPAQQTRVRQQWDSLLAALDKELDPARLSLSGDTN